MAEQKMNIADHQRLEEVALEIFSASMASGVHASQIKQASQRAFQGADAFLKLSAEILNGAAIRPVTISGPQLANCSAPNLPARHPLNLVAQKHTRRDGSTAGGDVKLIAKIYDRIKGLDMTNPDAPVSFEDAELGIAWDRPILLTAQQIFPNFLEAK